MSLMMFSRSLFQDAGCKGAHSGGSLVIYTLPMSVVIGAKHASVHWSAQHREILAWACTKCHRYNFSAELS